MLRDGLQHTVQILPNFIVPEAEDLVTLCIQKTRAGFVIGPALVVLAAVHFDHQLRPVRAEIGRVADPERDLLAPMGGGECSAQAAPKNALLWRHLTSQLARAFDRVRCQIEPP
jgi:hypothetical protein